MRCSSRASFAVERERAAVEDDAVAGAWRRDRADDDVGVDVLEVCEVRVAVVSRTRRPEHSRAAAGMSSTRVSPGRSSTRDAQTQRAFAFSEIRVANGWVASTTASNPSRRSRRAGRSRQVRLLRPPDEAGRDLVAASVQRLGELARLRRPT